MIYVLKTVEGFYNDDNVLVTLDSDRVIEKIKELHSKSDEIDLFVIELWNDDKIKDESFRTNTETDDIINRVITFIGSQHPTS